jgi:hypothetical protein
MPRQKQHKLVGIHFAKRKGDYVIAQVFSSCFCIFQVITPA